MPPKARQKTGMFLGVFSPQEIAGLLGFFVSGLQGFGPTAQWCGGRLILPKCRSEMTPPEMAAVRKRWPKKELDIIVRKERNTKRYWVQRCNLHACSAVAISFGSFPITHFSKRSWHTTPLSIFLWENKTPRLTIDTLDFVVIVLRSWSIFQTCAWTFNHWNPKKLWNEFLKSKVFFHENSTLLPTNNWELVLWKP